MGDALEIYYKNGADAADLDTIEKAVQLVERLLGIPRGQHVIGGSTISKLRPKTTSSMEPDAPPAPATHEEAAQYRILLGKLEGNYRVAEGMLLNEANRHPGLSREALIKRIVKRFESYGR